MKAELLMVTAVFLAGCASDSTERSAMHMGQYGYTYDLTPALAMGSANTSIGAAPIITPKPELVFNSETKNETIVSDLSSANALPITATASGTTITNATLDSNLIVDRERSVPVVNDSGSAANAGNATNTLVIPSPTVITEPAGASTVGDTNLSRTGTTVITNVPTESTAILRSNNLAATHSNATVRAVAPATIISEPAGARNQGAVTPPPALQTSGALAPTPNFGPSTVTNGPAPTPLFNNGGTDPNAAPAPTPNFNPTAGPNNPTANLPANNGQTQPPTRQTSNPGFVPQGSTTPATGSPAQPSPASRQVEPSLLKTPEPAPGQGNPGQPLPNPAPGSTPAQNGGSLIVPKR